MEEPRVDPSDWASRRQNAMNRAKELRLKMKERESSGEPSSSNVSSSASSKANLQRERRSRQLEETQRLLDGYDLNNLDTAAHKSGFDTNTDVVSVASRRRAKKDRVTSSNSAAHYSKQRSEDHVNTQSVVSKEHLARIHGKYNDSTASRDGGSTEKRNKEYAALSVESKVTRNGTFIETAGSSARLDNGPTASLREQPIEGRGRGRGRNRSATTSGSNGSSLGEMSQSMKKKSPRMIETSSRPSSEVVESYLKERRVPDFKEGECEKLAILRQKLVARRQRNRGDDVGGNKENEISDAIPTQMISKKPSGNTSHSKDNKHNYGDEVMDHSSRYQTPNQEVDSPVLRNLSLDDNESVSPSSKSMNQSQTSSTSVIKTGHLDLEDEESVVAMELIQCTHCKRSFAPKVYEKHFDTDGQPKCLNQMSKKRAVFNSAKARIVNNDNLNRDEQMQVIQNQKKVAKELAKKKRSGGVSKRSKKNSKWKEESASLRDAMKANRLIAKAEREGKPAHYYL